MYTFKSGMHLNGNSFLTYLFFTLLQTRLNELRNNIYIHKNNKIRDVTKTKWRKINKLSDTNGRKSNFLS